MDVKKIGKYAHELRETRGEPSENWINFSLHYICASTAYCRCCEAVAGL